MGLNIQYLLSYQKLQITFMWTQLSLKFLDLSTILIAHFYSGPTFLEESGVKQ